MTTDSASPAVHRVSPTAAQQAAGRDPHPLRRLIGLTLGLAVFAVMVIAAPPAGLSPVAWNVAAVAALMAVWWIMEAIPIAATALVPLALFPLFHINPIKDAAAPYANPLIFLFLGGFMIALAMERWNLHRRIALGILRAVGLNPRALVGGFMAATAFLSAWVSNTATATMMLPIALSVIELMNEEQDKAKDHTDDFALALLLGIAFSASIGGMATLVGTPPNALLAGYMAETYGRTIGFAQWLAVGGPLALVLLALAWVVLTRVAFHLKNDDIPGAKIMLAREVEALGPVTRGEQLVAVVFVTTAVMWVFRPAINGVFPGLGLTDPGIAIIAALCMFAIPADWKNREFLMDWRQTSKLPWGVLILVGGGLSLGAAIQDSGLSAWVAGALESGNDMPTLLLIIALAAAVMGVSHLTSNTATAAAFLPLAASLALSLGENPLVLMVPAVLAASCVFMMPVATPPNAIVFASGLLTVVQMARAGAWICAGALVLIVLATYALLPLAFAVDFGQLPVWAQ